MTKRCAAASLALAALASAAVLAGQLAPAHATVAPEAERYGIVRVDAAGTWSILADTAHQPSGLTSIVCASGTLTVTFLPLATIGVFLADEDETYAGRFDAGASVGLDRFVVTFHRAATGAVVRCDDPALRLPRSNLQLMVIGTPPA